MLMLSLLLMDMIGQMCIAIPEYKIVSRASYSSHFGLQLDKLRVLLPSLQHRCQHMLWSFLVLMCSLIKKSSVFTVIYTSLSIAHTYILMYGSLDENSKVHTRALNLSWILQFHLIDLNNLNLVLPVNV